MEIYFDKETIKLLRYIKNHPKNTLQELHEKFGDTADSMSLINLCMTDYLVCTHPDGSFTVFKDRSEWTTYAEDNFWISPKGKKILDDLFDRTWQWLIPTSISALALVLSIAAFIYSILPGITEVRIVP